jgi:HSP20 family protein
MPHETFVTPSMSVLPFDMFRSFAPAFDYHSPFAVWTPLCDVYETEKEIVLKLELPDIRKEDVHITLENNVLTFRGKRTFEEVVNRERYHRFERKFGEFLRIFTLPTSVEGTKVVAELKNGTLTVTLPKNHEAIPRQIEVKVT